MSLAEIAALARKLRAVPETVARKTAAAAAPELTDLVRGTVEAGTDAYGTKWQPLKSGRAFTASASRFRFFALRGLLWLRYRLSKRPIGPQPAQGLPDPYLEALDKAAQTTCSELIK